MTKQSKYTIRVHDEGPRRELKGMSLGCLCHGVVLGRHSHAMQRVQSHTMCWASWGIGQKLFLQGTSVLLTCTAFTSGAGQLPNGCIACLQSYVHVQGRHT